MRALRIVLLSVLACLLSPPLLAATKAVFRAGACVVDITPVSYPVIVNAMFTERSATNATDRLHARALALDDGTNRLVIVVVDSCMVPRDVIDRAKAQAQQGIGLATDHMLVSATHTHSAPSAMGCLGSRADTNYATFLVPRIASAIVGAVSNLTPARVGWGSVDDWDHTFCRRWIRRPDRLLPDPFGERNVRANMHPGYESGDVVGPSGPVDPGLSVLALQTVEGKPLALLANYSQHYYGSPLLSSDYYGRFCGHVATLLDAPGRGTNGFVAIMSQGTSGDMMWMDYSAPAKEIGYDAYAKALADKAAGVVKTMTFHDWVPLDIAETTLNLGYRVPDEPRYAWARDVAQSLQGRLPRTQPEIYALECLYLHDRPRTELKVQALRIGELGIAALPNEVYAITGLKLKAQSPLPSMFNIELANGAEGYIPPPEQHKLGGYTTWAARTAGLETGAEPRIAETALRLLEKVSGKGRRHVPDVHGPYATRVLAAKPLAYWRLNESSMPDAYDATGRGQTGQFEDGVALYLPGVDSRRGFQPPQPDVPNAFSGEQINRAPHFAGGRLRSEASLPADNYSVELWFWNGLSNNVRGVTGWLFSRSPSGEPSGAADHLGIGGTQPPEHAGKLIFHSGAKEEAQVGRTEIAWREWHHLIFVRRGSLVTVYLDGNTTPEIAAHAELSPHTNAGWSLFIAGRWDAQDNFEGKIDEVSVYDRALSPNEVAAHYAATQSL